MINVIDQIGKTTYLASNDKKTNDFLMEVGYLEGYLMNWSS